MLYGSKFYTLFAHAMVMDAAASLSFQHFLANGVNDRLVFLGIGLGRFDFNTVYKIDIETCLVGM